MLIDVRTIDYNNIEQNRGLVHHILFRDRNAVYVGETRRSDKYRKHEHHDGAKTRNIKNLN